ncbi:hypothetical protein GE09DRAFT_411780 [Coniochaeta sp. 2T2.1]|nr:hypothetical protein GE09DRAFT_411780 [Coniochaeta sp. 2T2.1]
MGNIHIQRASANKEASYPGSPVHPSIGRPLCWQHLAHERTYGNNYEHFLRIRTWFARYLARLSIADTIELVNAGPYNIFTANITLLDWKRSSPNLFLHRSADTRTTLIYSGILLSELCPVFATGRDMQRRAISNQSQPGHNIRGADHVRGIQSHTPATCTLHARSLSSCVKKPKTNCGRALRSGVHGSCRASSEMHLESRILTITTAYNPPLEKQQHQPFLIACNLPDSRPSHSFGHVAIRMHKTRRSFGLSMHAAPLLPCPMLLTILGPRLPPIPTKQGEHRALRRHAARTNSIPRF